MNILGPSGLVVISSCFAPLLAMEAPDSFFRERPAFSRPEVPAEAPASCETIARQLPGVGAEPPAEGRVDLWINGKVTLVQTDGALSYVAVCSDPGVRVLCVAYDANGLKVGDVAALRGAYSRPGKRHIQLDPCLASPAS